MLHKLVQFSRYQEYVRLLWWRTIVPWRVRQIGVNVASNVSFMGMPIITMAEDSSIEISQNCSLCSVTEYTALGVNHPVIIRTLREGAKISIGSDTGISGAVICAANHVEIGANCLIGANVIVIDTDFHALKPDGRRYNKNSNDIATKPVVIGNNVFIGTGAIILKGVTIGDNSVIGAGSVVTKDITANVIAVGNPACVIAPVGYPS